MANAEMRIPEKFKHLFKNNQLPAYGSSEPIVSSEPVQEPAEPISSSDDESFDSSDSEDEILIDDEDELDSIDYFELPPRDELYEEFVQQPIEDDANEEMDEKEEAEDNDEDQEANSSLEKYWGYENKFWC